MGVLLGPPIVGSNRFDVLVNGDEIFPSMLTAIRDAQHTLDFETYIYWSGQTGHAFAQAIADRARAGVRTHVIIDWVGRQSMDQDALELMRKVKAAQYVAAHPDEVCPAKWKEGEKTLAPSLHLVGKI